MSFCSLPLLSERQLGWSWAAGFAAWNVWFALTGWYFGWGRGDAYALFVPGLLLILVVSLLLLRLWAVTRNAPLISWAEWTRQAAATKSLPLPRLTQFGLFSTLLFQVSLGASFWRNSTLDWIMLTASIIVVGSFNYMSENWS